jgi:hypothetical protein
MEWMRCKKSRSMVADRRTWESRCRRYKVMESHITLAYGKYKGSVHCGYADVYYAMHSEPRDGGWENYWSILSKHRKRNSAEKACVKHEQETTGGTDKRVRSRTSGGPRRKSI